MDILAFLQLSTMTLATASSKGFPHVAPVYFAAEKTQDSQGWAFYFFSAPDSLHAIHIREQPQVAAAIYPETWNWQEIRGLQMRGAAHALVPGVEWERAWSLYRDKFPFVNQLKIAVARNTFYRFQPVWIRLVDNRRGFGHKEEWILNNKESY